MLQQAAAARMQDESIVHLNGEFLPLAEARIPVLDRGFIFGDGIYEVVPVYGRVPFRWPQHQARLRRSLDLVRIENPMSDADWTGLVRTLVDRHRWADQFVYLQVTRGVAKREHAFPAHVVPTVFGMTSEMLPPSADVIGQGVAAITLPDERWLHCDIKSTSLLGNVLARQAAVDAGAAECVMFRNGFMTEGSASNIWVVRNGRVLGAPRDHLVLEGIRVGLMEALCAACGLPLEFRNITREEVFTADELLSTSATKEVLPITSIDGRPVDTGVPGPIYARLYAAYQEAKSA